MRDMLRHARHVTDTRFRDIVGLIDDRVSESSERDDCSGSFRDFREVPMAVRQ